MTVTEQKKFIRDLIDSVSADILKHTYDMPSSWDGIELRQYIADRFARETFPMGSARGRNYRNTIATTTL
jgi:capsid portal protein